MVKPAKAKKKKLDKAEQGKRQTTITHKFTALFPAIFEKAEFDDGKTEYGITMLFPKKVDLGKPAKGEKYSLEEIVHNAAVAQWGEDEDDWPEDLYMPFRDGDTDKKKKGDPTYKGMIFVRAKNGNRRPGLVDGNLDEITDPDELYAGCVCRAQVYAFAYDKSGNAGVGLILHNVQKIADGEQIGGMRMPANEAFGAIEEGEEDEDAEDEKPAKKKKKSLSHDDDDEDDDEGKGMKKSPKKPAPKKSKSRDEDDEDEDDEGYNSGRPPLPKSKKSKSRDEDEDDDDDDLIDEDEDDDDTPPPPPKKKKKK